MMRRSGASPVVKRWKFSCEMLRRAASGHMPATQLSKFAAASRIALAVIRGWPEAPSSPLQGIDALIDALTDPVEVGAACGCAGPSDFWPPKSPPNRFDSPPPPEDCAWAVPLTIRASASAAILVRNVAPGSMRRAMSAPLLPPNSGFQEAFSGVTKSLIKSKFFVYGFDIPPANRLQSRI